MIKQLRTLVALLIVSTFVGVSANAQTIVQTFSFTGALQTFTVPACVSNIAFTVNGAQGGSNAQNIAGGLGGSAYGVMPVTAGNVLFIYVGGTNGYNGGGTVTSSGCASALGGVGGGASDIRLNTNTLTARIVVAGGGGGAGGNRISGCGRGTGGGGGGGWYGGGGGAGWANGAAGGGGPFAGGNGGTSGTTAYNGTAGTFGFGGVGGPETTGNQAANNTGVSGGVGGGLSGGAGSLNNSIFIGGSGGGGSSYLAPTLTASATTSGNWTGNGQVILSYNFNGAGVTYSASPSTTICAGTTVTLTAGSVVTYTWLNNNSNSTTFTATPTSNTAYTVQGTNSIGCISTTVINVSVDPTVPSLTVANTASLTGGICPTSTVNLTASGATTYTWTNGVSNGVTFGPISSQTYIVTGSNACGNTTAAVSVSVHPAPTVSAVVSQPTVCSGVAANLTAVGNATSYAWSGGVINGVNFFPLSTNIYTVTGFSALGCSNTAVAGVSVVTTPANPPVPNPPLICIGSTATLSSSGATTYSWITSTGVQSGSLITVSPTATSIYTLTKSNANCVNTQTVQIIVNNLPVLSVFATPTLICASNNATLNAGGAQTYTWNGGGTPAFTVTGSSPVVSPSITTTYTLSASDGTCANTTTLTVTTNPNPTITIAPTSTNICRGDQVSLTANGALGYTWTTVGISSTPTSTTILESPLNSSVYIVTGTNNFNCSTTAQQVVVVRPTPTLQIGTTKPLVCTGAPSSMTVTSAAGAGISPCTYVWGANAAGATTSVVTVNPLVTTSYSVVGLAPNGCTSTVNYPISVFLPTFAVNSPTQSCQGGTVILTATGANTYTWNGNQPFQSIPVSPPSPTVYLVSATSSSNSVNCISTRSVQVTIYNNPTVTAVATRTQVCKNESTTIAGTGAVTYTLNTGASGTLIPVFPVGTATNYTLTGTDQNGCTGTSTVQIKTSICFGIEEASIANKFTVYPNPNNGNFKITSDRTLHLQLYSQLGQLIQAIELSSENGYNAQFTNLAEGVYYLKESGADEQSFSRIIVTH